MTFAMRVALSMWILCVFALLAAPSGTSEDTRLFLPHRISLPAAEGKTLWVAANEECSQDSDCDILNSKCQGGTCQCIQGEVITSDMTRCLPVALGWGASCQDTAQCSARLRSGGICVQDSCQCADGFHYQKGKCWLSAGLGGACSRNERCYANYDAESYACKENKCQCAPGHYQREYTSCRRQSSAPGEVCGIKVDCHFKGAVCEDKLCACPNNTVYDETKKECVPFGGSVTSRSDSETDNHIFDWTFFGYGHHSMDSEVAHVGTKGCPSLENLYGMTTGTVCRTDKDCEGHHSSCSGGQCTCNAGYFTSSSSNACYPELLQTCISDKECHVPQSVCSAGTSGKVCSCKVGFVASQDRRICRKMTRFINWSCLHPEQCSYFGPSTECKNKKCKCTDGSHWEEEKQYCWTSVVV